MASMSLISAMGITALSTASAQDLPSFDIFVVGMSDDDVSTDVFALKNITRRDGYDNQPFFSEDGNSLVYTSDAAGYSLEIFMYTVRLKSRRGKTGINLQLTYTRADEFSPTIRPGGGYTVVRVEEDKTQRLWSLVGDALSGELLMPDLSPVGYYSWIDEDRLAVFILGAPSTLQIAHIKTGETTVIAADIGRTIVQIPGSLDISFTQKESDEKWVIKKVNPDSGEISEIAPAYGEGQDFTWTPSGKLLMADGSGIFEWIDSRKAWRLLHDFAGDDVNDISRLTVNPQGDLLAFVAAR